MKNFALSRYAFSLSATAAFLSGCQGSQPAIATPPTGTSSAMQRASALAPRAEGTKYKVVLTFSGPPGARSPYAGLIDVGGTLYGTTMAGGTNSSYGLGTVFSVTPSGKENVLHDFGSGSDGSNPEAGLIDEGGTFYGTTSAGGSYGACRLKRGGYYYPCGTVFSITRSGTEKVLHNFGGGADGINPVAPLIDVNGTLYGTTKNGGTSKKCEGGCGTVFSITPSGTERVLHVFGGGSDGANPAAALIEVKGQLYGTTEYGGGYGGGAVFKITLSGRETLLHGFGNGTDGAIPSAGLIDVGGTFYGTTEYGGALHCKDSWLCGTVFSMTPSGTEKVLHAFSGDPDGAGPVASLIVVKGTLYGTTSAGGSCTSSSSAGCGTIFSITPSGAEAVVHDFRGGADGVGPASPLTNVRGMLYGTTTAGGDKSNGGTIFALTP